MTPPHDLALECCVIGSVLLDHNAFYRMESQFVPENFYAPAHQEIVAVMRQLLGAGRTPDGHALREHFEASSSLSQIGGAAYLEELLTHGEVGPAVADYARMLESFAARRSVLTAAGDLQDLAADAVSGFKDADQVLSEAESVLGGHVAKRGDASRWLDAVSATDEAIATLMEEGGPPTIRTGIGPLDARLGGFFPGDLVVLAGRPAMGKSAIAQNIAFNAASDGHVVGLFSQEMDKRQLAYRAASAFLHRQTGEVVPYRDIRRGLVPKATLERVRGVVRGLPPVKWECKPAMTVEEMRMRMRRLKAIKGRVDLAVIDYLQIMDMPRERGQNDAGQIQAVTSGLKRMAMEFECPVLLLSQLSRAVETRDNKRPRLSDLRGSGSIEQDADVVIFAYREHYYASGQDEADSAMDAMAQEAKLRELEPRLDLIIAKARNDEVTTATCFWNAATSLITHTVEEARAA